MTETFHYSTYGLWLHANRPVPGLTASPHLASTARRVQIDLAAPWHDTTPETAQQAWYTSPYQDISGTPLLKVWKLDDGAYFRFVYSDDTVFVIDQAGTHIRATWPQSLTLEDTATYLLGPGLGFVLRQQSVVCLHASAIAIDNQAIALLGPAGAGKSTTAAAFAELGYSVLSDDIVALADCNNGFLVQPGYPRLRLWPESVHVLRGSSDALPRLTPTWDKRYLDLTQTGYQFQSLPLPLAAIYVLGERRNQPITPFVEATSAQVGLFTLIANTYMNYVLDKSKRAHEFELLSRVAAQVPIRRVTPHTDATHLTRLCDAILEDVQRILPSATTMSDSLRGTHV